MCGFVGSIPKDDQNRISVCLQRIAHRGPDSRTVVETPKATLGHARLSILDVEGGDQPMQDQEAWIVFNGEIYNYQSLRRELPGHYRTESDTETLLRQYQNFGPQAVEKLDGMFSFVVAGEEIFMARDPIGIKPLYYARRDGRMYFASEVKALLPLADGIQEFPAGSWWHSSRGWGDFFDLQRYRSSEVISNRQPGPADYARIHRTVSEAVRKRLIADPDVPVGVSLSGGLDSSIIAALARHDKETLDTFVVGMAGSEDIARSKEVARFLGTKHHVYTYNFDEMLGALEEVIYYLESYDAALVRSAIPNFFLARLASETVKVILTGEGADELFAGYDYLHSVEDPSFLHNELLQITSRLHNTNLQRTDRMTMAHGIEGRVPFLDRAVVDLAFSLPADWKLVQPTRLEKDLLRVAFKKDLPGKIVYRPKQKFSHGAGSFELMAEFSKDCISDQEFHQFKEEHPELGLRSKEELYYYYIFRDKFGERIPPDLVGRTRSITHSELQ
jgi:asparagine synthase (glutamine-hydrolysing)